MHDQLAPPRLNKGQRRKLECLRRRRDFLASRTGHRRGEDWDRQEAAALTWAIEELEARDG